MKSSFSDAQGRQITYIRLSVTDRCDMRCTYCMSENMQFLPRADVLDFDELERISSVFIRRGVRRIRLTGGEPLVRRGIDGFVARLGHWLTDDSEVMGLDELTLTTNGSQLTQHATALAQAGIKRVNVSLDSLDPARFTRITRRGELGRTLEGIKAAKEAGLAVRVNVVAMAGVNEDEFDTFLRWGGEMGIDLCLIETMPMGDTGEDRQASYLPLDEVRRDLARRWTFETERASLSGPARYVRVKETGRKLGFITPLTEHFCASCNRVRVSCTGQLYTCLGFENPTDLRAILRRGGSDAELAQAIDGALGRKPVGHNFFIPAGSGVVQGPARHMSVTGG